MTISRGYVAHIARLARIELTSEEEDKYRKELSAILGFIEKLRGVDTQHVLPMTGGTILENVMRLDRQVDKDLEGKSSELIKSMPEQESGWLKVKSVFHET